MSTTGGHEKGAALAAFAEGLWLAEGPVVSVAGFRYPTRMAVARLADASLFIWSPVALSPELREEVSALGQPLRPDCRGSGPRR